VTLPTANYAPATPVQASAFSHARLLGQPVVAAQHFRLASSRVACGGRGLAPTQPSLQSAPTGLEPASTASAGAEPVDQRDAWACLSRPAIAQRAIRSTLFHMLRVIPLSSHSNFRRKPPTLQTCYSPSTLATLPAGRRSIFYCRALFYTRHRPSLHYRTKLPAIEASAVVPT
jgi:hypothetical protein